MSQWAERNGQAFAWVSVDEKDNDPKVLLTYVAEALDAVQPVGQRVFDALASPASSVPGSVVPRLGAAFAAMTSPVELALDDVHLLYNSECRAALSVLAEHVPAGSRLALAGRTAPPPGSWPTTGPKKHWNTSSPPKTSTWSPASCKRKWSPVYIQGRIATLQRWYSALNLELDTLSNYRYYVQAHILPVFGTRSLASLNAEEIGVWEKDMISLGYTPKVAREARSTLSNMLGDAIPRYIQVNPAARRRGKGRRGQRGIERIERAGRQWATSLEALLLAERCAALSAADTDFVMIITVAYTGMRWSEALGLLPGFLQGDQLRIDWKLYELESRFYRGRPKDGSIRSVDMPPFLAALIGRYLATCPPRVCACGGTEPPWCPGDRYVFLGARRGHFRRSNYSSRIVRPAADGWYLKRGGPHARPAMPVLADMTGPLPGRPLPPWPSATADEEFRPPQGRGVRRLGSDSRHGRCPACGRSGLLRQDGTLVRHKVDGTACPGTGHEPEQQAVASRRAVRPGLTPHGLRHGHRTWLDDLGVQETLKSERMGHEIPGMAGVYGHIMPQWRQRLRAQLQELWEASLQERALVDERSAVGVLVRLLAPYRASGP